MLKLAIVGFLVLLFCSANAEVYRVGIVPQQSASRLAEIWNPVLTYLSTQTGDEYIFATAPDIPTFETRLLNGDYDFAYMNPYHLTVFSEKPGYQAIAKQSNHAITGIIVVAKDSPIQTLEQLHSQTIAFPSPAAFAASVIPQAVLTKQNIPFKAKYVSSHDSVYLNVAKGFLPAGGGIERTFMGMPDDIKFNLRILWQSKGYTSHAIAVHPRVDETVKLAFQNALIQLIHAPLAAEWFADLYFTPLEAATNDNWDDIRALDIQLLNHLLE